MSFNGKHLTLEQRKIIEENISNRVRKYITAAEITKSPSTIGKEIRNNRKRRYSVNDDSPWMCKHYNECKICISICYDFEELPCADRDRFIGVCNGCKNIRICKKQKYFYYANIAQKNYEYTLKDSRLGVDLNTTELFELAHIICPLIKQCEKTIYTYIEMGLFKDWSVTNLELRRKVKRKINKKKKLKKKLNQLIIHGRKYGDYINFEKIILQIQQPKWILSTTDKVDHIFKLLYLKILIL